MYIYLYTYLYYSLNVKGDTLPGSLSLANANKTWIISKNKVSTNTNHEYIHINVISENLCEFIQNRVLHSYTCRKSRSNGEKTRQAVAQLHNSS